MKALAEWLLLAAFAPLACAAQNRADAPELPTENLIVETLTCRGNSATGCEFILGHIYLAPGDRLDEAEIQNAQLRLSTLRTFESVRIYLEKGSERGKALVVIEVVEAEPVAAEWLLGASNRRGAFRGVAAGRLTHQNLFGAGKLADFALISVTPISGPKEENYAAVLRYADPHFFGSKRYFAIASASYADVEIEDRYGNFGVAEVLRFGLTVGRRLWDFSYVTVGYGFRPRLHQRSGRWQNSGHFELDEETNRHVMDFIYGWNSEDDLYFPTRGSSFHIGGGFDFGGADGYDEFHLQFRKTWQTRSGLWTVKLGGDPSPEYRQSFNESQGYSFAYARPLAPSANVRRGRWYIESGFNGAGYGPGGETKYELGLKFGIRLDTETFGLVDLYVLGTGDPSQ